TGWRYLRPAEWGPTVILRDNNPQDRMSALPPKADIEMARIVFGVVAPAASPHCSQYYLFEWFEQKRTRFGAANGSNCLEKFGGRTRIYRGVSIYQVDSWRYCAVDRALACSG